MYPNNYPPQYGGYPPPQYGGYPPQQRGGYVAQQRGGYPPQPKPVFKRSGCTKHASKTHKGAFFYTGWRKDRNGMVSFIAHRNNDNYETKSKTGNEFEKWTATITMPDKSQHLTPCLLNVTNGKLLFNKFDYVANPNAPEGYTRSGKRVKGYFGSKIKRK
jgi:hypothetical protein